ncbi:MAG: amidohydrolase family protein [Deltaproteobacteria bacterium]|nr:amidohydrolase family protein [Deltaproteobacteria bacterium]
MRTLPCLLVLLCTLWSVSACAATPLAPTPLPSEGLVLVGATVVGQGQVSVTVAGESITAVGASSDGLPQQDLTGHFVVPAVIDAHVHLAYLPAGDDLARGGVAGAIDWAAPLGSLAAQPLEVRFAGPIITAVQGYPTQGWGQNGYGLEVSDAAAGRAAVGTVAEAGATVVKIALGAGGPELSDEVLRAICEEAHSRGMLVGAHALRDDDARRAAEVGADILVHAPVEELSPATVAAWSSKAVIATISAFSGVASTRQLAEAGATVLYGTDFGNTRALGVSAPEIEGLVQAGLAAQGVLDAATSSPAEMFGLTRLGAIAAGKEASLLILDADPLLDPTVLARPVAVLHRGAVASGTLPGGG